MRLCVRSLSTCARDEVAGEEVAHDPQRQLGLLVDERGRASAAFARAWIVFQSRCRKTRSRSTSSAEAPSAAVRTMTPPSFDVEALDDVLQPRALGVLEPPRDAEALAVRDVDEEPAGQRDLGRQPGALRLHRILDRLDEQLLAARDQILDLLAVSLALELGHDDLVDVEEAVLLEPDLDERRLHAGQHVVDDAEVDVPGDRAALGPLEVHLGDAVVLDHGDALLADVDRDQQLALRGGKRRPPRRLAAPLALPA